MPKQAELFEENKLPDKDSIKSYFSEKANLEKDIEGAIYDQKFDDLAEQKNQALEFSAKDWVAASENPAFEGVISKARELEDVILLADDERLDRNIDLECIAAWFEIDKSVIENADRDRDE